VIEGDKSDKNDKNNFENNYKNNTENAYFFSNHENIDYNSEVFSSRDVSIGDGINTFFDHISLYNDGLYGFFHSPTMSIYSDNNIKNEPNFEKNVDKNENFDSNKIGFNIDNLTPKMTYESKLGNIIGHNNNNNNNNNITHVPPSRSKLKEMNKTIKNPENNSPHNSPQQQQHSDMIYSSDNDNDAQNGSITPPSLRRTLQPSLQQQTNTPNSTNSESEILPISYNDTNSINSATFSHYSITQSQQSQYSMSHSPNLNLLGIKRPILKPSNRQQQLQQGNNVDVLGRVRTASFSGEFKQVVGKDSSNIRVDERIIEEFGKFHNFEHFDGKNEKNDKNDVSSAEFEGNNDSHFDINSQSHSPRHGNGSGSEKSVEFNEKDKNK